MSGVVVEKQYFNVLAPRDGTVINLVTSAVAANLALTALLLPVAADLNRDDHVYLTLVASGADVFVNFSPANVTLVPATTGQASGVGLRIPAGTSIRVRISRKIDKVLNYIATGAGNLYVYPSSPTTQFGVGSQ